MLEQYKGLFRNLKSLSGVSVMSSSIASKVMGFALSILVVRFLNQEEFGVYSFAASIIAFIAPLNGMGLNHALLRFGAIRNSFNQKQQLLNVTFSYGLLSSFIIISIVSVFALVVDLEMPEARLIIPFLSLQLIGLFLLELKKVRARLLNNNRWFAIIDFTQVSVNFVLSAVSVVLLGLWGYLIAVVLSPLLALLFNGPFRIKWSVKKVPEFKSYITYGLNIGLGSVASSLLFYADIIILGLVLVDPSEIALYKTASLIPIRLIFIPVSFLTIYYVRIAKNYQNKKEILTIIKHYLMLFVPISIVLYAGLKLFDSEIINFLFGEVYESSVVYFDVFLLVIPASYLLRALFGNILAALGKSDWNAKVAWFILILNIPLNYFFIIEIGAIGAAYVTVSLIGFSGIISAYLFIYYWRTLKIDSIESRGI